MLLPQFSSLESPFCVRHGREPSARKNPAKCEFLWAGHVMFARVTLPGCFKQMQNRGVKPAMMGALRPANPGCSLVPHRAENGNVEGEARRQLVQRDGTVSDVFGIHRIYTASSRTPKLVSCSRCGCLESRACCVECLGLLQLHGSPGRQLHSSWGACLGSCVPVPL